MPHRTGRSARPVAGSVRGGPARALGVGLSAGYSGAGRDERTRLRFSRISIARCADVIRSPASAWGPLSQSVHPVTGARATGQRPCARDLRPGGAGGTAELRQEMTGANGQAGWCWLLTPGSVLSGVPVMAGTRGGIRAGGTGDLSGPARDDIRHALVRQRRGGRGAGASERMRYPPGSRASAARRTTAAACCGCG